METKMDIFKGLSPLLKYQLESAGYKRLEDVADAISSGEIHYNTNIAKTRFREFGRSRYLELCERLNVDPPDVLFLTVAETRAVDKLGDAGFMIFSANGDKIIAKKYKAGPIKRGRGLKTRSPTIHDDRLGYWLSAALDDKNVCGKMKIDIRRWFDSLDYV
jgi:hypothetical protein